MDRLHESAIARNAADLRILAAEINAAHKSGEAAFRRGLADFREAGLRLLKVKEEIGHGRFKAWVEENIEFSYRTAADYMRIAREWAKCAAAAHLRDALRLLKGEASDAEDEAEPPDGEATSGEPPPPDDGNAGILDAEGHPVPDHLRDAFREAGRFKEIDALLRKTQAALNDLAQAPAGLQLRRHLTPTGYGDTVILKSQHLNELKSDVKYTRPHSVCPWCRGEAPADCRGCSGVGWVTKLTYDSAGEALKASVGEAQPTDPGEEAEPGAPEGDQECDPEPDQAAPAVVDADGNPVPDRVRPYFEGAPLLKRVANKVAELANRCFQVEQTAAFKRAVEGQVVSGQYCTR